MKVVQTAVLDSFLFSSLTKTHNCRLIVAKIWTDTKSAFVNLLSPKRYFPIQGKKFMC